MTMQKVKRVYKLVENERVLYAVVSDGPLTLRGSGNISEEAGKRMDDIIQYPMFFDVVIENGVLAVRPQKWYGLHLYQETLTSEDAQEWLEWGNSLVYAAGEYVYVLDIEDVWPTFNVFCVTEQADSFGRLVASMGRQFGTWRDAENFITALAVIEKWRAASPNKPPSKE